MLRTHQRWSFILILIIAVFMSACQPAVSTPTPSPRPPATTAPTEAATTEATTEVGAATTEATTEAGTAEATTEMVTTEAATAEATVEGAATAEETLQVVLPPTDEMTAEPTMEVTIEATSEATMEVTPEASAETRNLVEVATADGNFKTLLAALAKANLIDTLEGAGPYTVFAPTDSAFEKLLSEMNMTEDELLNSPNLADILKFHVIAGSIGSDQLEEYRSTDNPDLIVVPTLDGDKTLDITFGADDAIMVNGLAKVTLQNVAASNGVLHVIDTVLIPPTDQATPEATAEATIEITLEAVVPTEEATIEVVMLPTMTPDTDVTPEAESTMEATAEATVETRNIVEVLTADGNFKTLLGALVKVGLADRLNGDGPFTVFAPTDTAFEKLLDLLNITAADFLDRDDLAKILKYHIVEGAFTTDLLQSLSNGEMNNTFVIPTLDDEKPLSIVFNEDGTATINDAVEMSVTNIVTSNGIIHVIDVVMLPPEGDATPEATAAS